MANAVVEDIISKLPEPLISHILSFLPTKDAVRTCVLSKRWIYSWISISKLDLDDSVFYTFSPVERPCTDCNDFCTDVYYSCDKYAMALCSMCFVNRSNFFKFKQKKIKRDVSNKKQHFVNFAYKAVLLTGTNCSISSMELERFSLVIHNKHDVSNLNAWILNILTRRVKNLRIHSSFFKLPFSALTSRYLFNSTLLEELDLVLMMCSTIRVPTIFVRFGHLKLLNLSGIFLNIDSSGDYLTLSLPVLKKFDIKNCTWSIGKDVIVEAPLLESIFIGQDLNNNLVGSHDAIKFTTLRLKQFTYSGYGGMSQKITLSDASFMSFASAKFILKQCDENKVTETRCLALHLLQQFHQVKCIKFEGLEVLTQADIPVFAMLSHLELGLVTVEVLSGLLQKSPTLKTLYLTEIPKFAIELLNSTVVPDCLASTIKVVKFEKVNGEKHELCLARFFMEKGMMLERMGFSFASQTPGKSKVMEEFKKLSSTRNDVEFSYE